MANNFQRGDFTPINFQRTGGASIRVNIKSHSLDIESLIHDVTHTGHDGIRARIAGVEDAKGTINCDTDLDLLPWIPSGGYIRNGVSGIALFWIGNPATNPQRYIQIPCIIPKVHYETGVEQAVKHSFDVAMNRIAGVPVYVPDS